MSTSAPPARRRRTILLAALLLGAVGGVSAGVVSPPSPVAAAPASRIFGGTVTRAGDEPPFLAQFASPDSPLKLLCSGVLITARHVLTIASCSITVGTRVRLGAFTAGSGGEVFSVSKVAVPNYRRSETSPLRDNIAVVTFTAEPIWTVDRLASVGIIPVALDGSTRVGGGRADATLGPPLPPGGRVSRIWGWGTPNTRRDQPLSPPGGSALRSAQAVVIEAEACNTLFAQARNTRPNDVYCAKSVGEGPCLGDSGAGLVSRIGGGDIDGKQNAYVHGLYSVKWSSTLERCVSRFPQGYTSVRTHAAFIRDAVSPQSVQFVTP
ncbi:hypothetical protein MMPV_006470 [Pyropia vietnamensis]